MKNFPINITLGMFVLAGVLHIANTRIDNKNAEIKAKQQVIDSLQNEISIRDINIGRYEITLELLSQEDEPAAAKFDSIYNNETE